MLLPATVDLYFIRHHIILLFNVLNSWPIFCIFSIFLSMLNRRWRWQFNRFDARTFLAFFEPSYPFSLSIPLSKRIVSVPAFVPAFLLARMEGRPPWQLAFLHSSLLEVRSRKKKRRRAVSNPRSLALHPCSVSALAHCSTAPPQI